MLLNVAEWRSDALVITPRGIDAVPVPGVTPAIVAVRVSAYLAAVGGNAGEPDEERRTVTDTHEWLWSSIVEPVPDRLGFTFMPRADDAWPRLWWSPTGQLSFLPLHAAGRHETRHATDPCSVLDRMVSSYTPTLRTLIHTRRQHARNDKPIPTSQAGWAGPPRRVAAVVMPTAPAAPALPGATREAAMLDRHLPGRVVTLDGPRATFDAVHTLLPDTAWAHFACHASSDLTAPSASHLLFHDHQVQPFTVVDVAQLRLDHAELAFLSACSTARPGGRLTDEAIHLTSAFQLAGYRHVIGTLWPINDSIAVGIADEVYTALTGPNPIEPAQALHDATRRLRNLQPHRPSLWASHLHSGI